MDFNVVVCYNIFIKYLKNIYETKYLTEKIVLGVALTEDFGLLSQSIFKVPVNTSIEINGYIGLFNIAVMFALLVKAGVNLIKANRDTNLANHILGKITKR